MKKNGFTLVEIMMAVAVVGLLLSLGAIALRKSARNAKTKAAQSDLEIIASAVLQLAWDTGRWPNGRIRTEPGSTECWNLSVAECGLMDTDGGYPGWKGPYYGGTLLDPWGKPYFFDPDYPIDGVNHIVVGSFGPNGAGRNDDIYVLLDD